MPKIHKVRCDKCGTEEDMIFINLKGFCIPNNWERVPYLRTLCQDCSKVFIEYKNTWFNKSIYPKVCVDVKQ